MLPGFCSSIFRTCNPLFIKFHMSFIILLALERGCQSIPLPLSTGFICSLYTFGFISPVILKFWIEHSNKIKGEWAVCVNFSLSVFRFINYMFWSLVTCQQCSTVDEMKCPTLDPFPLEWKGGHCFALLNILLIRLQIYANFSLYVSFSNFIRIIGQSWWGRMCSFCALT